MRFLGKKLRLLAFLVRRIPQRGWAQFFLGLRQRPAAYQAMDLAAVLPPAAATVIDVGAHRGDVAEALDFLYQPRRLLVVEPNPDQTEPLRRRFAGRPHIQITAACLGAAEGETAFFVHEFGAASSLFECRPGQLAQLGFSERRHRITVRMTTLERILEGNPDRMIDLLKLDCQGAELAVLKGAGPRLRDIRFVFCEVAFDSIYAGAPLFADVHSFLRAAGFALRHLGDFAGAAGRVQWGDALYENSAPGASVPA